MDRQNRAGVSFGAGGVASSQMSALQRKERLRKLAMETIDLTRDPYFMKNHLGTYECKLCQTLHKTEGNYLAHTQGKRHQTNLARRAARDARENGTSSLTLEALKAGKTSASAAASSVTAGQRLLARAVKIGRPGYKVIKRRHPSTGQRSLAFELHYPDIEANVQPRLRFMSTFEQRVEPPNKDYQYVLFAAAPYETIAFKVPSLPLDKGEGKMSTRWDREKNTFYAIVHFLSAKTNPAADLPVTKRVKVRTDI